MRAYACSSGSATRRSTLGGPDWVLSLGQATMTPCRPSCVGRACSQVLLGKGLPQHKRPLGKKPGSPQLWGITNTNFVTQGALDCVCLMDPGNTQPRHHQSSHQSMRLDDPGRLGWPGYVHVQLSGTWGLTFRIGGLTMEYICQNWVSFREKDRAVDNMPRCT